jgi:TonB family protein
MWSLPLAGRALTLHKRWLLGAGLSLALHAVAVSAVVVSAGRRAGWGRVDGVVDLARAVGDHGVPADAVAVDLAALPVADVTTPTEAPTPSQSPRDHLRPAVSPAEGEGPALVSPTAARMPARTRPDPTRARAGGAAPRGNSQVARKLAANASKAAVEPPVETDGPETKDPVADKERAAYRARLRRHMHEAWRANEVFMRIDPNGRLEGSLFTTAVQLRLSPDGRIARAELGESSGIATLDKEALAAIGRMAPMPPVPPHMIDAQGGWPVLAKFFLDVGMFRFAAEIRRALADKWRPSRAFATTAVEEKKTIVKLLLERDGTVLGASVLASSGLGFLDENALTAAPAGWRLPPPPPAFTKQPGPAQVFIAFLHQAGDVRVLRPREDVEEE